MEIQACPDGFHNQGGERRKYPPAEPDALRKLHVDVPVLFVEEEASDADALRKERTNRFTWGKYPLITDSDGLRKHK